MLEPINIVGLITALGLGTILTKVVDAYLTNKKQKKENEKAFTKVFEAIHEVYYELISLVRNTQASRVLLLKTTNGGGIPRLSGKLYSSVMYEAFDAPLGAVKAKWQNQLLDESYMALLYDLNQTGKLILKTKDLAPGMLKNIYLQEGIKASMLLVIHERDSEYIYMSVNFTKEIVPTPELNNELRIAVSNLANLFKKYDKI